MPMPITVIGGYLGAGKTTLLNALLAEPGGRRLGVVVNDFGELGVDASLISASDGSSVPVANLANGCVCCTLGEDLASTLSEMSAIEPRLDHIVVEASGVADPAVTAAWGTVPPFVPGGTIVLAAADGVQQMARDKYVGGEVLRQLEEADLLIVTKSDLVGPERTEGVVQWLHSVSAAPVIDAPHGEIDVDIVLGAHVIGATQPKRASPTSAASPTFPASPISADDRYERWAWNSSGPVAPQSLEAFLDELPPGLLRLKGVVEVQHGEGATMTLVQVVGTAVSLSAIADGGVTGIEAIGIRSVFDPASIERLASKHLGHAG